MCSLGCRSGTGTATATVAVAVAVTALKAGRQTIRRTCGQTNEGEGERERRTSKDPKHAQSEEVRPGRQSAVVVEIGCETVSHGITITTHTNTRAHTQTHTHTRTHSNIEAQPQLKSFYCPQHKRAQRASVSESGRANTHTDTHTTAHT